MYDAGKEIVNGARQIAKEHEGKQVTFDMEVLAEYIILTDQKTLEVFKSHLKKGETDDLYNILKNNEDPRQTQKVNYRAINFKSNLVAISGSVKSKAGKDKWI